MRERWACPDLGASKEPGRFNPVPGAKFDEFDDCPAYYLRTASMRLPADHLIDGMTHPATLIQEYAFEIENGARSVETVSPKVRDLVHLHLAERRSRDNFESEKRAEKRGKR